jgi:hypothetical protein
VSLTSGEKGLRGAGVRFKGTRTNDCAVLSSGLVD